jgi:hypothetical protein
MKRSAPMIALPMKPKDSDQASKTISSMGALLLSREDAGLFRHFAELSQERLTTHRIQ